MTNKEIAAKYAEVIENSLNWLDKLEVDHKIEIITDRTEYIRGIVSRMKVIDDNH